MDLNVRHERLQLFGCSQIKLEAALLTGCLWSSCRMARDCTLTLCLCVRLLRAPSACSLQGLGKGWPHIRLELPLVIDATFCAAVLCGLC